MVVYSSVEYWFGISIFRYIEIIICQFSYHTPYQPETSISDRDSRISQGLMWESSVDTRYDMKTDIS